MNSQEVDEAQVANESMHLLKPLPFKGGVGGGIWRSQFLAKHHPNPSSEEEGLL